MAIEAWVRGQPVAQPRPRVSKGGWGYVPHKHAIHAWRREVGAACKEAMESALLAAPEEGLAVRVAMTFVMRRPQRLLKRTSPVLRVRHTKRPDVDNLVKGVLDAMGDAGIFSNDSQVQQISATKFYAAVNEVPHLYVRWWWEEGDDDGADGRPRAGDATADISSGAGWNPGD